MDNVNILSLVDLLRALGNGRQLILSTSNPQLQQKLSDKLRPGNSEQRVITHTFEALTEDGPTIFEEVNDFVETPALLPYIVRLSA